MLSVPSASAPRPRRLRERISDDVRNVHIGQLIRHLFAAAGREHEARLPQRAEVLGDQRLRHSGRLRQCSHGSWLVADESQQPEPRLVAESFEQLCRIGQARFPAHVTHPITHINKLQYDYI
jgi:hypothetical protein